MSGMTPSRGPLETAVPAVATGWTTEPRTERGGHRQRR